MGCSGVTLCLFVHGHEKANLGRWQQVEVFKQTSGYFVHAWLGWFLAEIGAAICIGHVNLGDMHRWGTQACIATGTQP